MFDHIHYKNLGLKDIQEKVLSGQRLSADDGVRLFRCPDIHALGALADHVRRKLHGNITSYVANRQINYTNVCVNGCAFCAFRRDDLSQPGAYLLSHQEILDRIEQATASAPLDELHIVGGCHPDLALVWFEELLENIKRRFPTLPIKAFTPVEIRHFAQLENIAPEEVLKRLKRAGLVMMPGGGAEIFNEEIRNQLCPQKATAKEWLEISSKAHALGISTNCTMLFGHIESYEHRVDHLIQLRKQQDESGGFTCFIPLPFLKRNSRLKLPPERMGPVGGIDKLRTIAVSRLMLDNIPHIKAYWVMLGIKLAQTALHFGANDLDGTIIEERIGQMAGASSGQALTIDELESMIRESGFEPGRRNASFEHLANSMDQSA